jgi:hypothetical protein
MRCVELIRQNVFNFVRFVRHVVVVLAVYTASTGSFVCVLFSFTSCLKKKFGVGYFLLVCC